MELLKNANIFAPEPLGAADLLVAGEQIGWIGPHEGATPFGIEVRDLGGCTVIPGIVDCHVHVTGGGGESGPASRVPRIQVADITGAGVTTVVGLLGTDDTTRSTSELVAVTRGLCDDGITAFCHTGGYHLPPVTVTGTVRGDMVHVDRIIGLGELAISDHRSSQPTLDEVLRVAADTHVAGLLTGKAGIVHFHMGDGERGFDLISRAITDSEIPPRVFNPTHVNRRSALLDEACDLARAGCTVDITAFPAEETDDAVSAVEALERYWASGAPAHHVTVSSDGGGCLPEFDAEGRVTRFDVGTSASLPATLAELIDRGHPLETALAPFTSNPAEILRLPSKGLLTVGSDADLVVLDDAFRVTDVMARGRWHVRDGNQIVKGMFE